MNIDSEYIEQTVIDAIENEYKNYRRDIGEYISTTEAIQCLRRSYFSRKYPLEIPPWSTSALIGKYMHEIIEKHFLESFKDYIVNCEQTFYDGILCGTVDILIRDPNDTTSIVIDLKTTSKLPPEPYYNHMLQVNAYLHLTDADIGYIVYIDKRYTKSKTSSAKFIKAFKLMFYEPYENRWVFRDYWLYKRVKDRAKILKKYLENNEIPQREWNESCNTCEHLNRCIECL